MYSTKTSTWEMFSADVYCGDKLFFVQTNFDQVETWGHETCSMARSRLSDGRSNNSWYIAVYTFHVTTKKDDCKLDQFLIILPWPCRDFHMCISPAKNVCCTSVPTCERDWVVLDYRRIGKSFSLLHLSKWYEKGNSSRDFRSCLAYRYSNDFILQYSRTIVDEMLAG